MSDAAQRKPLNTAVLIVGLAAGAWYFFQHFEVQGLDQLTVHSKSSPAAAATDDALFASAAAIDWPARANVELVATPVSVGRQNQASSPATAIPAMRNLRVATWALGGLNPDKLDSTTTLERVASVIRGFDVVAIQQLRATQRDFVPSLMARASGDGRQYDYVLGPRHEPSGEQLAFFFDTNRIVTDRTQLYTVADPDQRISHDPLVGWFRATELAPNAAWTFSFVNVRIELSMARQETAELARILAAVARDGRGEDDCLLGGLFQADDSYLLAAIGQSALRPAIKGSPTDIFSRHQTSNLIYSDAMTTEAIGRGGVVDFLRRENLSLAEAERVSPYLPVYAEFSPREGGDR